MGILAVESIEAPAVTNGKDTIGSIGCKSQSPSGIEDLFEDSTPVRPPQAPEKFQANLNAESNSSANESDARSTESKSGSSSGIEDLFKDSTSVTCLPVAEKSEVKTPKNVKEDILNLIDKSNMVSPFAIHQQQLAFLSQLQALLRATAKSDGTSLMYPYINQQPSANKSKQCRRATI